MKNRILIKEFLKDKKVGAVASSSKNVVLKIVNELDFEKAEVIVEYGPGKGTITTQLLNGMKENTTLFVFETNQQFINGLMSINDKRLVIINEDAEDAQTILKNRYKIEKVDYVISTIPFTFLDKRKRKRVITKTYDLLKENGKFITYQYTGLIYELLKQTFKQTQRIVALINIPPAILFIGIR
jgi:phospholipid N-methyltransferase